MMVMVAKRGSARDDTDAQISRIRLLWNKQYVSIDDWSPLQREHGDGWGLRSCVSVEWLGNRHLQEYIIQ
jgi:hypothetical protein